jgi:hypothetical protein
MNLYIFLMKRVFQETSHTDVEISAVGQDPILNALKVVDVVTRIGYVTLKSIKTQHLRLREGEGQVGKLRVLLTKSPDFDRLCSEFEVLIASNPKKGV